MKKLVFFLSIEDSRYFIASLDIASKIFKIRNKIEHSSECIRVHNDLLKQAEKQIKSFSKEDQDGALKILESNTVGF